MFEDEKDTREERDAFPPEYGGLPIRRERMVIMMENNGPGREPEPEEQAREGKKDSTRLLTVIQIVSCLMVLAAAVLLKTLGGPVYDTAKNWYLNAVGDSIVTDDTVSSVKRAVVDLWPFASSAPGVSSALPSSSGAVKGTASQASSAASASQAALSSAAAGSAVSSGVASK